MSSILVLRNIGYQCKIGSSSLFGELTLAVLTFVGNLVFMKYLGDVGVGAFGIARYYTPFFFIMGNAVAQSTQSIISYNYGISRWKEIAEARTLLLSTSVAIGAVVALLFIFIPNKLVALFVDTASQAGHFDHLDDIYQAIGKKTLDVASPPYLRIRIPSSHRTSVCPLPFLGYRQASPRSLAGQRDIAVLPRPTRPPHRSSQ